MRFRCEMTSSASLGPAGWSFVHGSGMHRVSQSFAPLRQTMAARTVMQAITVTVIAIAILTTRTDPDLWGHLKFGTEILHSRSIPIVDSYSFTSDRVWTNHEWLSEVTFAL